MKKMQYTESHKSAYYGHTYDHTLYAPLSYDSRVWQLEQTILRRLMSIRLALRTLDYACGTGRITVFLERLGMRHLIGIDVSQPMLDEADTKLSYTRLHNLDITSRTSLPSSLSHFDTVLAFRFFLNADESLRVASLRALHPMMNQDALLIFNIHGNAWSIRALSVAIWNTSRFIVGLFKQTSHDPFRYRKQLSYHDVHRLLARTGYEIVSTYSYAFLPTLVSRFLPSSLWLRIEEKWITTRFLWGTHLLFVCKKKK